MVLFIILSLQLLKTYWGLFPESSNTGTQIKIMLRLTADVTLEVSW